MSLLPEIPVNNIAFKLKGAAEKKVKQGHPWVFDKSIVQQKKEGKAGDLAIIYENKTNQFLACGFYDPDSPIRIKVMQFHHPKRIDAQWFLSKVEQAYAVRRELLANTDTNSYRFIFGENDGFPGLIADVYDQVLVVKLYSCIWFPHLNIVLEHLLGVSDCKTAILRLSRNIQKSDGLNGLYDGQVIHGELSNEVVHFREHGVHFSANVVHGHKTGYFLDHRHNRKKVGELSRNKKVLDVFAYAGGFSVHALYNGAKEVVSVDISKHALELAKYNVGLNMVKGNHKTLQGDAFDVLKQLIQMNEKFDVVVIDPPSFAKKAAETEGALVQYGKLAALGIKLVSSSGMLVLASCSSRIRSEHFFKVIEDVMQQSPRKFNVIEKTEHDIDHPVSFAEGAYLKCGYYHIH